MRGIGRLLPSTGLAMALAASVAMAGAPASSQALFTDSQSIGANSFTSGVWAFFLHNNPTPPVGNTSSQATLPLNANAPTASTLFNYDTNRDTDPGLTIREDQYQAWLTPPLSTNLSIVGDVTATLWSGMDDFTTGTRGVVTVYLVDVDGSNYTIFASATLDQSNWQGGATSWVQKQITVPGVNRTIPAGHNFAIAVYVNTSSSDDIWFAYDTTAYPSKLAMP